MYFQLVQEVMICQSKLVIRIICRGHVISWELFWLAAHWSKLFHRKSTVSKFSVWTFVVSFRLPRLWKAISLQPADGPMRGILKSHTTLNTTRTRKPFFLYLNSHFSQPFAGNKAVVWHHSCYTLRKTARPTGLVWCVPPLPAYPHKHSHWHHLVPAMATVYKLCVCDQMCL